MRALAVALVALLVGALAVPAHAHDQSGALFRIVNDGQRWMLAVDFGSASIAASHAPECRGDEPLETCLVAQIENTVAIGTDGACRAHLGRGMVQLGAMSRALFEISDMPTDFAALEVRVETFLARNVYQHNLVQMIERGVTVAQKALTPTDTSLRVARQTGTPPLQPEGD